MRRSFVTVVYGLQLMALRRKIKFYLSFVYFGKKVALATVVFTPKGIRHQSFLLLFLR